MDKITRIPRITKLSREEKNEERLRYVAEKAMTALGFFTEVARRMVLHPAGIWLMGRVILTSLDENHLRLFDEAEALAVKHSFDMTMMGALFVQGVQSVTEIVGSVAGAAATKGA